MILYIFLSFLFIFGAVVFKWLIDRTYIDEEKFRKTCKGKVLNVKNLKEVKSTFIWKRRLYSVLMIGCILQAILLFT
jgi:hypothetical protein